MAPDAVPVADHAPEPMPGGLAAAATAREEWVATPAERSAPYRPSWVDRLIAWVKALPGPTWAAYVGIGAIGAGLSIAGAATSGVDDPAEFAVQAFWGALLPVSLWVVDHLAGVAGQALDAFRPALEATDDDAARLRHDLTVIPPGPALAILAFSAIFTPAYWVFDPAGSAVEGLSAPSLILRFFSETFFGAMVITLLFQSIRQLHAVHRIHTDATRVDLFRPSPLYAFSVLTSRTAIILALIFTIPTAVAAAQAGGQGGSTAFVAYAAVGIAAALLVFVVPLLGMQRRITAEKRRLQAEVGARIESTVEVIHAAVDAGKLEQAGAMKGALDVLVTERDLVDRLPTLPWRPGTLGAVATAVFIPLGLTVASRLLDRVL